MFFLFCFLFFFCFFLVFFVFFFFFFFQAEDGIRDRNVTGVQTCALPIYWHSVLVDGEWRLGIQLALNHVPPEWPDGTPQQIHLDLYVDDLKAAHERSEERRVGKECRSGWWTKD